MSPYHSQLFSYVWICLDYSNVVHHFQSLSETCSIRLCSWHTAGPPLGPHYEHTSSRGYMALPIHFTFSCWGQYTSRCRHWLHSIQLHPSRESSEFVINHAVLLLLTRRFASLFPELCQRISPGARTWRRNRFLTLVVTLTQSQTFLSNLILF